MPDPASGPTLGFDTSAAHCAAALISGDAVLGQVLEPMAKGQAERLFPILEALLSGAGVGWGDLAALGVGVGPGNFTGIRIAVAAARGLALSLNIPAVGVPVTEAAALDLPRPCRVVIPARGDDVIWQDFGDEAVGVAQQGHIRDLPPGPPVAAPRWPLAVAIARIAAARAGQPGLSPPAPLYLRPADAAPARDPAPVILA